VLRQLKGLDRVCRPAVVGHQRLDEGEAVRLKLPLIWCHVFMPPKTCGFRPLFIIFFIAAVGLPKKGIQLRKTELFPIARTDSLWAAPAGLRSRKLNAMIDQTSN
jgi:hypothetical protein